MKRRRERSGSRRAADRSTSHWLGLGELGTEVIVDEIDPVLYAIDRTFASIANRVMLAAVDEKSQAVRDERPFAVLASMSADLPWQVGWLSERFNVYLYSDSERELLDQLASRFGATVVEDLSFAAVPHEIELFFCSSSQWPSEGVFFRCVSQALELLAASGTAVFVVPGEGEGGHGEVVWDDGSTTPLAAVVEAAGGGPGPLKRESRLIGSYRLGANEFFQGRYLAEFLRRNRSVLGSAARHFLELRIAEWERNGGFRGVRGQPVWASILELAPPVPVGGI